MRKYKKLKLPADSAWDDTRFKWGKYIHWRIRYFFRGVLNIIRWMPTLYKDRDWDDAYILWILQKKIEYQRAYLVHANRHSTVDIDNFWMTVTLNLLQLETEEYYQMEYSDYHICNLEYTRPDEQGCRKVDIKIHSENYGDYLAKYPSTLRKVIKEHPESRNSKHHQCMLVSRYNQIKCRNLLFEILKQKSALWWD